MGGRDRVMIDGDYAGDTPCDVTVLPRSVPIFFDNDRYGFRP